MKAVDSSSGSENESKVIPLSLEQTTDKDEYILRITHDLKGPLMSMLGYNDLLFMPEYGEISQQKLTFVNNIRQSGKMLLGMINNIVDAAKIREGLFRFTFENFSLNLLLDELKATFGAMSMKSGINLTFTCEDNTWVYADRNRIRRVFHNLLYNSFRYTGRKGFIIINASDSGEKIKIQVQDTGKGIPLHIQNKIFEKYTQATEERKGSGLGLYIVKKFIEGHNSEIHLKSDNVNGTTFTFNLPKGKQIDSEVMHKGKILLFCDNPDSMLFIINALILDGHKVKTVTEGKNSFKETLSFSPDIIIICHALPNNEVDEFQKKMATKPETANIPIILLSDKTSPELKAKFHSIIPITIDADLLRNEVLRILSNEGIINDMENYE